MLTPAGKPPNTVHTHNKQTYVRVKFQIQMNWRTTQRNSNIVSALHEQCFC